MILSYFISFYEGSFFSIKKTIFVKKYIYVLIYGNVHAGTL